MQTKKTNWKKTLRWLPGVLVSGIALYAVLKFIKPEDLKVAFQTVRLDFILVLVTVNVIGLLMRGKVWQVILGKEITFKQAFFGISEGYFLNNVLPFRAGELGRSYFVGRSSGKGTFFVLSTIVIERAFDVAFAAALVMLTLPHLIGMDWIKPVATLALVLVAAGFIVLYFVAINKEKVLAWFDRLSKPSKLVNFILPRIRNILDGFALMAKPSQFLYSFIWMLFNWLVWTAMYCYVIRQVIPGAPIWWGAFVSGVMALGVAIPSAPSALGVYEASFVGAVAILGGQSGTALAYAIIMHLIQFASAAVFGIWGLVREGVGLSKIMDQIGSSAGEDKPVDNVNEGI